MKKFIALTLVTVMALVALTGCSSLKEDEKGANISVYMSSFPYCLDPAVVQLDDEVTQILGLIYEGLTGIDENGKVIGVLAKDWYADYDDIYGEYQMYFELRDRYWNDGRKVSADDVIYAWKRILDPAFESPYASILYPIKNAKAVKTGAMTSDDLGIAAVDDTLLCITFEVDYSADLFAEQIACLGLVPLREDIITDAEKDAEEGVTWDSSAATIVCNGKYGVKNLEEGIRLVLERNASYGRDAEQALDKAVKPYRITITYQENTIEKSVDEDKRITDTVFQANRFANENIYLMSAFDKKSYAEYGDGAKDAVDLMTTYVYYFNTENKVLADKDVRKALSLALDREKIAAEIMGTGEKAVTGYVPSGVFNTGRKDDFREAGGDIYSTSANVSEAKKLLDGKKGSISVAYLIPESKSLRDDNKRRVAYENVYEEIAKYAESVWEDLGFKVELVGLYEQQYRQALATREYDVIGVVNVVNSTDAYAWLSPFATRYSGCAVEPSLTGEDVYTAHQTNWESDAFDKLIDEVCYESDRAVRAEKLHEAEKLLADECPAIALVQYSNCYVKSSKLSGIGDTYYFGYRDLAGLKLKGWREINAAEDEASALVADE